MKFLAANHEVSTKFFEAIQPYSAKATKGSTRLHPHSKPCGIWRSRIKIQTFKNGNMIKYIYEKI